MINATRRRSSALLEVADKSGGDFLIGPRPGVGVGEVSHVGAKLQHALDQGLGIGNRSGKAAADETVAGIDSRSFAVGNP